VTQPPPPGPWDPQQPGQWQQGPGYPGAPGQYGPPQHQWPAPVPPKKGGAGKWILGAVSLVAVIAVTAVVAVSCTKSGGNNASGGGTSAAPNNSGIASANDTGPVGIITEDPSCAPWYPITKTLSDATSNGWDKRDPSIPAAAWTSEQRNQYQVAAQAMRSAADQTVPLAKLTPHRAMRELYEQFIAYSRAYADNVATYTADNEALNGVAATILAVVNSVCGGITYGAAKMRTPLVTVAVAPTHIASVGDPANPSQFMPTADPQCADWESVTNRLNSDATFSAWVKEDTSIPASGWSDQYKAENQAVIPLLNRAADETEKLAGSSSNPFIADLGVLGAQYLRAFVVAIPTYSVADQQLYEVYANTPGIIKGACSAAGTS
jgi:hypothetical protein